MALHSFGFVLSFVPLLVLLAALQLLQIKTGKTFFSRLQLLLLLLYSYWFLCSVDIHFGVCMAFMTLITFFVGIVVEKHREEIVARYICIGGVTLSLIILGYFKYCDFFIDSINALVGTSMSSMKVILPVGLSFYTFTAIGYMVDVTRGKIKAERNLMYFSLFMSFFAKVTAGPIVSAREFLIQVKDYNGVRLERFLKGIQIFFFGFFQKIVLADRLGVFVDDVFFAPSAFNTGTVLLAVISYSMQIFFDFSGYSDMATGLGCILGFDFPRNFNLPYAAQSVSEFWQRWHISLSSWLQEYLYIPLGGSRRGKIRTYINLLLTMIVSGLWHGAGYTFLLWGLMYGIASCVYHLVRRKTTSSTRQNAANRALKICGTFILVSLFWVMFRATDVRNAMVMYTSLFTIHGGISQPYTWSFFAILCLAMGTIVAFLKAKKNHETMVNSFYLILDLRKFWSLVLFFAFVGLTIILGYFGDTAFIYGIF